jgi:predicted TIM-barrel fold metal-dependent hydrolase
LALVSDLDFLFELQVFTSQMADSVQLAKSFPDTVFVLEHAGMLEDTSQDGWQKWRDGMSALAACRNVNVKLSGLGTFEHAYRYETIAPIIRETVGMFGSDRCLFGSNFPIEKLWTDYASLYRTFRMAIDELPEAQQHDLLYNTAARLYKI